MTASYTVQAVWQRRGLNTHGRFPTKSIMPSRRSRYLALTAALLGWMFDGMEMGLFPLVARDALAELLHTPSKFHSTVDTWYSLVLAVFLIGAATGGVVFGWLGDKIGRVRAMTVSVLLYSLASGVSGLSQEPWHFAVLKFLGALGMGGEWALGVALVMEVWANTSRAWLAGLIGAFGNLGYAICGLIALGLNHSGGHVTDTLHALGLSESMTHELTRNCYWRLLMVVGAAPALLTFLIRLFVPESEKWSREKASGRASHWSGADLLGVFFGAVCAMGVVYLWWTPDTPLAVKTLGSLVGLSLVAAGYLYPVRRYLHRVGFSGVRQRFVIRRMLLAAGLSGVALLGTWCAVMWMYQWVGKLPGGVDNPDARPMTQVWTAIGAALGCGIGAVLCERFGRRIVYAALCICSVVTIIGFYQFNGWYGYRFLASAAVMSMVTAAFYGWLPLYLPELFPTAVRATGQGFGFNFGRILAAAGSLQMPSLLAAFDNNYADACAIVPVVYVVGLILIAIAPETRGKPLPE